MIRFKKIIKWSKIKSYYLKLSQRERIYIIFGSVIVGFILIIFGIVQPINQIITTQEENIQEQLDNLSYLKNLPKSTYQLMKLKHLQPTELLNIIQHQLNESADFKNLTQQLSQANNINLDIQFKTVPFEIFMTWLWKLSNEYAFEIVLLEAKQENRPGMSNIHLVIRPI